MMETVMIILTITIMDMDYRAKKVLRAKKISWLQLLFPNWFAHSCDDGNGDDYVDNYDYGYGLSC